MQIKVAKNFKIILIAFLIGITIFSVFKYISSLKEKYDLLNTLSQIKEQVAVLENDKQNLSQTLEKERQLQQKLTDENSRIQADLRASEEKLTKLDAEFIQTKNSIQELSSQLSALKAENAALIEEKNNLNIQLTQVVQEKDALKARLSSISELKKAIRELKIQVRKVGKELKQKVKTERIIEGNRGFLIKNGKSTYPAKVKIEVKPLPSSD